MTAPVRAFEWTGRVVGAGEFKVEGKAHAAGTVFVFEVSILFFRKEIVVTDAMLNHIIGFLTKLREDAKR